MGSETAAHALPPSATGTATTNSSPAQAAVGQHGSSSPQNSGNSAASGQQWPARDTGSGVDAGRPVSKPPTAPAGDGGHRRAPDGDCCTPRSELSFGHWRDKPHASESPQGKEASAPAEALQHGKAGKPLADSVGRNGGLPDGAGGAAEVTAADARPQGQPSLADGNVGSAAAQAAGAAQPNSAAPRPATDAQPAKRQSREEHLS
jgi:hypothetical protein